MTLLCIFHTLFVTVVFFDESREFYSRITAKRNSIIGIRFHRGNVDLTEREVDNGLEHRSTPFQIDILDAPSVIVRTILHRRFAFFAAL